MIDTDDNSIRPDYRATAFWTILFIAGMIGFPMIGRYLDWSQGKIFAGMIFSMFLLFPMVRAATGANRDAAISTPAMEAYNMRILFWSVAYVIIMFGSIWIYQRYEPSGFILVLIALLPSLPILWSITTIARYIREKELDEYVRHRHIQAGIFATGALLATTTIWGFLDLFGSASPMAGYMVPPIWGFFLGVGYLVNRLRGI